MPAFPVMVMKSYQDHPESQAQVQSQSVSAVPNLHEPCSPPKSKTSYVEPLDPGGNFHYYYYYYVIVIILPNYEITDWSPLITWQERSYSKLAS